MLARINHFSNDNRKVTVTKLDIDDFGSVIPVRDLELRLPSNDDSVVQTLRNSTFVAIFTDSDMDEDNSTIVLANGISIEELNGEKEQTIQKVNEPRS